MCSDPSAPMLDTQTRCPKSTPEKRAYAREYYWKNKDRVMARYWANRESNLARSREWKKKNRERNAAHSRKYYRTHPTATIVAGHKRRALKKAATINMRQIRAWMFAVKKRKSSICYYCGCNIPTSRIHFDHIIPLSKGGAHSIENLCVSCSECNLSKRAKYITAWIKVGQQVLSL